MSFVDLWPRTYGAKQNAEAFEAALEAIEASAGPFSMPGIYKQARPRNHGATLAAFDALLALGWITRLSPRGARPVYYAITPGCEPGGAA